LNDMIVHMKGLELKLAEHGSVLYGEAIALRRKVLREPLGLDFSEEQLKKESNDFHLVALADGKVVGCLVLTPLNHRTVQMRQVAVEPSMQGQGVGRCLVERSEAIAREQGFWEIVLHARESAVDFYLKLGYQVRGETFIEVTIPHREMFKIIRP